MHPPANRRSLTKARSLVTLVGAVVASMLCAGGGALAGPLNPPLGPIAPTAKPLNEVEPRTAISATNTPGDATTLFKITQPGSYYLTGNIGGVVGKHGIQIAASNVTLDLSGFTVAGVPGSLNGISSALLDVRGLHIRNGTVTSWGGSGVDLGVIDAAATSSIVERITSSNNTQSGITAGSSARVLNCTVVFNSNRGIYTFSNSVVTGCTAISNTGDGIRLLSGCVVSDCSVWGNTGRGINSSGSITVRGCSAVGSGEEGLFGGSGSVIADSTANGNIGVGITVAINATITGCSSYQNGGGGFSVSIGSTITACSAYNNTGNGFVCLGSGCTVSGCTARQNSGNGIQAIGSSSVVSNNCALNGNDGDGAGLLITGADNRIEGNNCVGQDRGIEVTGSGNLIIRNSCSGNTSNWEIAANNKCLVVVGANAAAISGNSGGVSPGSTDPNANYTY